MPTIRDTSVNKLDLITTPIVDVDITALSNNVEIENKASSAVITDIKKGTSVNVAVPVKQNIIITGQSIQGSTGPQGQPGEIPSTDSFVLTSSFNAFTSSYYVDSASFNINISNNSSSISLLSGSFKTTSGSFSTRITNLENFSSSLDATFATDAELNAATASLSASISYLSSSFETFSGSYNTGSFTGSFIGDGTGLYNIPASGIVGLNLSQITSGSVSASISPNAGLQVNTNVTATSFTGSLFGTASIALTALTASYIDGGIY
jgi:hypothetical protein